jgi:hypothetical protein
MDGRMPTARKKSWGMQWGYVWQGEPLRNKVRRRANQGRGTIHRALLNRYWRLAVTAGNTEDSTWCCPYLETGRHFRDAVVPLPLGRPAAASIRQGRASLLDRAAAQGWSALPETGCLGQHVVLSLPYQKIRAARRPPWLGLIRRLRARARSRSGASAGPWSS